MVLLLEIAQTRTQPPLCSSRRPLSSPPATIFRAGAESGRRRAPPHGAAAPDQEHALELAVLVELEGDVVVGRVDGLDVLAVDDHRVARQPLRVGGVDGVGRAADLRLEGELADAGGVGEQAEGLGLADVVELQWRADQVDVRVAHEVADDRLVGGTPVLDDQEEAVRTWSPEQVLGAQRPVGRGSARGRAHSSTPSV